MNALLPTTGANRCTDPAFADLQTRFVFNASGCGLAANILRVKVLNTNGPDVTLDGFDASLEYRFDEVLGGRVTVGGDATYNLKYEVGAVTQFGLTLTPAFDAVGKLNVGLQPLSLPQFRSQAFAEYERGLHDIRVTFRYADAVADQRAGYWRSGGDQVCNGRKKTLAGLSTDHLVQLLDALP